jgi:hypothetical protein
MGKAGGKNAGLARACPGQYEKRTFRGLHGFELRRVEAG